MKERMLDYKDCGMGNTLQAIGSKWTMPIIYELLTGTKRFSELQKELGVSPRALSIRLDQLEQHKIISRKVYPVIPPKVEYRLTEKGRSLNKIISLMADWGSKH